MREDVKTFLESLRKYLYGDLDNFKRICDQIEKEESKIEEPPKPHGTGSNSSGPPERQSSITIKTTSPSGNTETSGYRAYHSDDEIKFRSTIPHTLAVLAAIDLLGYLIGNESNARSTEKNIAKFLESNIKSDDELKCLVFIYRHGMSHSFFPKLRIAIAAHSKLSGKDLFYLDNNSLITLNANTLIEFMIEKFDQIMSNTSLHENIESQFDRLLEEDKRKLAEKYNLDLDKFASTLKVI